MISRQLKVFLIGLLVAVILTVIQELRFSMFTILSMTTRTARNDLATTRLWIPEITFSSSIRNPIEKTLIEDKQGHAVKANNAPLPFWQQNNPFFQTVRRDTFCHGCRVRPDRKSPCADPNLLVQQPTSNSNHSNLSSPLLVNETDLHPQCRQQCLQCPERDHWYGRFDEAAPPVRQAVSHYLSSIPDVHRFPHNLSSWHETFLNPANAYPNRTYLSEYNPSLVRFRNKEQIPPSLAEEGAVYLASFRVTSRHFCHANDLIWLAMLGIPDGKWPPDFKIPPAVDYLGLAWLREDLSLVADAVFDLRTHASLVIEDSRLFYLHDQLYWSAGANLHPLWITPPPSVDEKSSTTSGGTPLEIQPKFASDRWTSLNNATTTSIYIQKAPICPGVQRVGKNIQYFVDPMDGAVVAEMYPAAEKIAINVSQSCPESIIGQRPLNNSYVERSFGTVDEVSNLPNSSPSVSSLVSLCIRQDSAHKMRFCLSLTNPACTRTTVAFLGTRSSTLQCLDK